jgi:hypothetical protein
LVAPLTFGNEYAPKIVGRIDDLAIPAADVLRQLPGVMDLEALVTAPRPVRRIIHIRDWRLVSRNLYAADLRQALGKNLIDEEVAARQGRLLIEVELVQLEQERLLRSLVAHHGLRRLLAEGLTPEGVPNL